MTPTEKAEQVAIVKLARLCKENGFTKEEMAHDLFDSGLTFEQVVKVSNQMDYMV